MKDGNRPDLKINLKIIGKEISSFKVKNLAKIKKFLKKNELDDSLDLAITKIFYALSLSDEKRYVLQTYLQKEMHKEWYKREFTLKYIRDDKTMKSWLKFNDAKLDELIEICTFVNKLKPMRVNHRTFLFVSLKPLWYALNRKGVGQQKQLNIVYDLFKEYRFQDYHHENNFEEKRDRIRKTYQEPGLKQALKEYEYGK